MKIGGTLLRTDAGRAGARLGAGCLAALAFASVACSDPDPLKLSRAAPEPFDTLAAPFVAHEIPLRPRALPRPPRVLLDAGHGAKENRGNTSSFGVAEEDFTRLLAYDVHDVWAESGLLEAVLTREDAGLVPYAQRVGQAQRIGADFMISLHSDVRADGTAWSPFAGQVFLAELTHPGFVVIFSDEGAAELVDARRKLAIAVARAMRAAGFVPYLGGYSGLYDADPEDAAVLVDRHEPKKRIYILRASTVPAVLVETHHALDPREALAWEDETTRRAFALALGEALLERAASVP